MRGWILITVLNVSVLVRADLDWIEVLRLMWMARSSYRQQWSRRAPGEWGLARPDYRADGDGSSCDGGTDRAEFNGSLSGRITARTTVGRR